MSTTTKCIFFIRLKSIWPGVQSNLDGIILVYDTNNELHVRDMSALHMHFVTHSNLAPSQCLIIGNQFRGNRELGPAKIVGVGPRVRHFVVNVDGTIHYICVPNSCFNYLQIIFQKVNLVLIRCKINQFLLFNP